MWLNDSDIDYIVTTIPQDHQYYKYAKFLNAFKDLINSISDGWPYWSYGTRCSEDLQKLVWTFQWPVNQLHGGTIEKAKLDAAVGKVRRFLQRSKQTKDSAEVKAFLKDWRVL